MNLHSKYYKRFLWLCSRTGLADYQMRAFVASIIPGGQKRLGDYMFRLLSIKHVGMDTLYSVEVYFMDAGGTRRLLVLKSPLLLQMPHRNRRRIRISR